MKSIFMGTPEFAVPSLKVARESTDLLAVFTQPDKKRGRGQKISASPVKEYAIEHGIEVIQPSKLRESTELIRELSPELIIVVAYGKILPREILEIPRFGCINVHGSLLPKYRGAAPIQWALINGERSTGITTMKMDENLDTGDILLQRETEIDSETTFEELHDRLKNIGAEVLNETIENLHFIPPRNQINSEATYSQMITKETQKISWQKSAWEIHNLIRALDSHPGAISNFKSRDGKIETLKIWKSRVVDNEIPHEDPGKILKQDGFYVATGAGALEILEIQAQGSRRMSIRDFLRGHDLSGGVFE